MQFNKQKLESKAFKYRKQIIKILKIAGSGHIAGAMGIVEILTYIYNCFAKVFPNNPESKKRDYILLSPGHMCPILYVILADLEYFPRNELYSLRKINALLQGHPRNNIPGVESTSGLLGHGLSQAVGIAISLKIDKKNNKVICILSDGEQQEGQVWEAAMSAYKFKLDNLIVVLDYNNMQADGYVEEIMPLLDISNKYKSFGWKVIKINGNEFEDINKAFIKALKIKNKPTIIVAKTTAGKGVSFMENKIEYHVWRGDNELADKALLELDKQTQ